MEIKFKKPKFDVIIISDIIILTMIIKTLLIMNRYRLFNKFSTFQLNNHYDLISIGSYANKSAKIIQQTLFKHPIKILTVTTEPSQIQPSLFPLQIPPVFHLSQDNHKFAHDIESGVFLQKILPKKNTIILSNGQQYTYRGLIYSGAPENWKNMSYYSNLQQNLAIKGTFAYSDLDWDCSGMFKRKMGTIAFIIPKSHHFACQNMFMISLKNKIRENQLKSNIQSSMAKVVVLNQGKYLDPFNKEANQFLQKLLASNQIEYHKQVKLGVDYRNQQISLSSLESSTPQKLSYDSLFHYIPESVPKALSESDIHLSDFNKQTTLNQKYQNISIVNTLGSCAPSIQATNRLMSTAAFNIYYQLLGINKSKNVLYDGYTQYYVWLKQSQALKIAYNNQKYLGDKYESYIGASFMSRLKMYYHAIDLKIKRKMVVDGIINGSSDIYNYRPTVVDLKKKAAQEYKI